MGNETISLMIITAGIILSAYFSATETAFSSLNRIRIKNMAEKGNKKACLVMRLSENYDWGIRLVQVCLLPLRQLLS